MDTTFILQKAVVDDLFIREDEFKSFLKFIKKHFRNYTLITDFQNEEEFMKHSNENPILELLLDKFKKIKYITNLKSLLEDKSILNHTSNRSIVISNIADNICNDYLDNHGLLFFNLTLLKKWSLFDDVIFSKSIKVTHDAAYPNNLRFSNFIDFTKYLKYCTSLIIFDKFLFEDKTDQKISKNLYPFIESVLKSNDKMEIMVISEFKDEKILQYHENLHNHLTNKGFSNYKLNLVHHYKAFYPRKFEGLHSRFILSNYLHIRSNDSFNFFKDNGDFNNLADIDIKLNLTTENSFSYTKDLEAVKVYLSKIKNEENCPNKNLKVTFCKNKTNNLLD
uniref:hypothetical protein n=1 Tax=Flavobacterium sp. TaxID=239 RepID=UPI004048F49D